MTKPHPQTHGGGGNFKSCFCEGGRGAGQVDMLGCTHNPDADGMECWVKADTKKRLKDEVLDRG